MIVDAILEVGFGSLAVRDFWPTLVDVASFIDLIA